jgi:uncharacterized Zn-binding protein involved in type VI secretion
MTLHKALLTVSLVSAIAGAAYAQEKEQVQAPVPGVVARGSSDVLSGGLPAARAGDATTNPGVVGEGSKDVLINGKPAARLGDRTDCGVIARGSSNVFINGKPMARVGDNTSGC